MVRQGRRLGGGDAAAFQALRLSGLRLSPDAFGSSWEEEVDRPLERTAEALANGFVAGCERDGVLVGIGGLRIGQSVKTRHRGMIWGVYVDPDARGLGVGKRLMTALIDQARAEVEDLTLTVSAHNETAIGLYRSLGFEPYGLDRRSLKIGDDYVDELLMRLDLAA
jgi:ribosomal protein S18 acetylase RimI-like enzyme